MMSDMCHRVQMFHCDLKIDGAVGYLSRMFIVYNTVTSVGASPETVTTKNATRRYKGKFLSSGQDVFRIMAPKTAQIASFQEYTAADTRSIVYGKMLNVRNSAKYTFVHINTPACSSFGSIFCQLFVDNILRCPRDISGKIFNRHLHQAHTGFLSPPCDMRGDDTVGCRQQRIFNRRRLGGQHIQRCAGKSSARQRLVQCGILNKRAS